MERERETEREWVCIQWLQREREREEGREGRLKWSIRESLKNVESAGHIAEALAVSGAVF